MTVWKDDLSRRGLASEKSSWGQVKRVRLVVSSSWAEGVSYTFWTVRLTLSSNRRLLRI